MRNVEEKFKEWLSRSVDREVNEQLQRMADDKQAMTNAFYKDLEFWHRRTQRRAWCGNKLSQRLYDQESYKGHSRLP